MDDYFFERLSENNIQDLIPVYLDAFKKKVEIDFLIKKHNTSKIGPSFVGYIAYTKDRAAVAFYGVFVWQIEFQGKSYLGAQAGDTMTHSSHTGKGLFTQLALKTQDLCESLAIDVLYAFPNQNSLPGFVKKLGWSHYDEFSCYEIRVKCIPWIRLKNTFKIPQVIHNTWCLFVFSLLTKGKPFVSSCLKEDIAVVKHSADFFAYKSYSKNHLKKIGSTNVWFKHDDMFLILGDLQKSSEKDFLKTIKKLKRIAFFCGLPHLRFHSSSETNQTPLFSIYGNKMEVTYPIIAFSISNKIPLEKMKFTAADNDTF